MMLKDAMRSYLPNTITRGSVVAVCRVRLSAPPHCMFDRTDLSCHRRNTIPESILSAGRISYGASARLPVQPESIG